jgi:hypothetical protein
MNSKHWQACAPTPFARNHYFPGKMLMERDFTDEQLFHAGKLQYHQKHLHGRGVACGLKVKPHPNPACRDRVVIIEPGAAFDCCGRTIAVTKEVCFTFADDEDVAKLPKDGKEHTLQICIRYRECEVEPVPVLFDDCGDGSRCEPNRVVESFEFDVKVDPPPPKHDATAPKFAWKNTLNAANARAVVLHEQSHRIYILTAGNPGTVFPVNADNRDFLAPLTLGGEGKAMAVSKDGKALVVAFTDSTGLKLRAFDVSDFTKPPVELTLPAGAQEIELLVAPDGQLFGVVREASAATVQTWGSALLSASPIAPTKIADAPQASYRPAFSTDGTLLYTIDLAPFRLYSFDLSSATPTATQITLPTNAAAQRIAIAHDTAGDTLVVSDGMNLKLHFRAPDGTWSQAAIPQEPLSLATSPGGAWVYVLESDGTDWFVRAISIRRAQKGLPQPPNAVVKVGKQSQQLVLTTAGHALFVPFLGESTAPAGTDGGVAMVDVAEQDCGELLWQSLDGCPECEDPDCVVLATVEHYHVGDQLEDPLPSNATHAALIDNRTGRVLLPSTQVLTEVIQCMLEDCHGGGEGKQGPPGPAGPGVTSADAESVPPSAPAEAIFNPATGNIHFRIPKGEKGDPGTTTATKLVSVCRINWTHAPKSSDEETDRDQLEGYGIIIAFNGKVRAGDINRHSFAVFASRGEESPAGPTDCWCELRPKLLSAARLKPSPTEACPQLIPDEGAFYSDADEFVNGASFLPETGFHPGEVYRVILKGDLIRADAGDGVWRSLDGNHLYPWVPARPSGDGIEGGTFESWFRVKPQ